MKIKNFGRTGLKVSEICLGTMTFGLQADEATSFEVMDVAEKAGINFFDTADVYPLGGGWEIAGRTEEIVGRWIKERGARDRIVLATKARGKMGPSVNDEGLSRRHLMKAVEASLKRLQTDHIDLYQLHSPDLEVPIEETLRALDDMVRMGMVRYVGCSNYLAWQLGEALMTSAVKGLVRLESVQPRYNLLFRMIEDEILPLCRSQGLAVMVYNPLAGGMLTGKYRERSIEAGNRFSKGQGSAELYRKRYWQDPIFEAVEKIAKFLEPGGKQINHVALAWVMAQEGVTCAILGASKPEQLRDSLKGVDLKLDSDEMTFLNSIWFDLPRERDLNIARR